MNTTYNLLTKSLAAIPRSQKGKKGSETSFSGGGIIIPSSGSEQTSGTTYDGHTHSNMTDLNRVLIGDEDNFIRLKRWDSTANEGKGGFVGMKASAGFADEATHAEKADYADEAHHALKADHSLTADYATNAGHADNADVWNQRPNWLNQTVRTKDKVVFTGITVRAEDTTDINRALSVENSELTPDEELETEDLREEGYEALSVINPAIGEIVTTSGSVIGGTIGSLDNVNEEADHAPDGSLLVMKNGEYIPSATLSENVTALMEKVFPFTISTLLGGGTYEKGSTQTVILSWSYDRTPDSQTLNGAALTMSARTKGFSGVTSTTTYTLTATSGGMTASKSVSASFQLKKYYGVSAASTLSNAQILSLSQSWAARTQAATTFDCTGGKYIYYVLPTSLKSGIQFWISGLRNTDWTEEVRNVTNASGYTESYTVYRIAEPQTGVLTIEVK